MEQFWKQFKSGTDIRGVAVDGVEGEPLNLTDEVIEKITSAYTLWLSEKADKPCSELKISIGHDSRISAQRIRDAAVRSLSLAGVHVLDCGSSVYSVYVYVNASSSL